MELNLVCVECLAGKHRRHFPADADDAAIEDYQQKVNAVVRESCGKRSSPETISIIHRLYREHFGELEDYHEEKVHFNELMLGIEDELQRRTDRSPDPLRQAVRYALTGNYIDFAALGNVDEHKLLDMLDNVDMIQIDDGTFRTFREEILGAKSLVYLTDNCGEIVCDKILIRVMKRINPELKVTVIVRGEPVFNDATMEDALQVRMDEAADEVMGNGTDLPGTVLSCLNVPSAEAVEKADILISKGQANYEGLHGCGKNVFYLLLCKCNLFMSIFRAPKFAGILAREEKIEDAV